MIVVSHCVHSLDHALDVLEAALLLEVLNLLPKLRRDLSSGSDCVEGLREAVVLQELAQLLLILSLLLIFLVKDLLKLALDLVLHGTHLRRDDVSELIFDGHLGLDIV